MFTQVSDSWFGPNRCANTFAEMITNLFGCQWLPLRFSVALGMGVLSLSGSAQNDTIPEAESWWKGLFRVAETPPCHPDTAESGATSTTDPVGPWRPVTPAGQDIGRPSVGTEFPPSTMEWVLPEGLAALDSMDKANPPALQGYRIQIYFGDLQEARGVRATFRRDYPDVECQLLPIPPNYAVTVGNFRDVWNAQRALRDEEVGAWKHAIVVPSPIDLPPLR